MIFLQQNIVAFLVALLSCTYAWVWGGTRSFYLLHTIPWVWVLLLEGMLFFPQRRDGETTPAARLRVWKDLRRDPLAWTIGVFLFLLVIPFLNTALCPVCDAEALAAGTRPGPLVKYLPFCTNRYEHLNVFLWFAPVLTAVLAVRHSLAKSGQRLVIRLLVFVAASLAVFGFIQRMTGALAPYWGKPVAFQTDFFASFGYTNMAADYFMTATFFALALWRERLDEMARHRRSEHERLSVNEAIGDFVRRHWPLVLAALLFAATLATLSRAGILLVTVGSGILFVHALISYFARLSRLGRVRAAAGFLLAFSILAVAVMSFMPTGIQKEVETVGTTEVLDRITGRTEYHTDVALRLVKDNPLFGCGGWGYRHYSIPYVSQAVRDGFKYAFTRGGANVHNDSLQFMVEHGVFGYALLVFTVFLLLSPTASAWRRLARAACFSPRRKRPPSPVAIFALPAPAFSILIAATATVIHSFGDCPLRSPAVLSLFFIGLAAVDGYLPDFGDDEDGRSKDEDDDNSNED